jgi:arginine decarboxylase-like protein
MLICTESPIDAARSRSVAAAGLPAPEGAQLLDALEAGLTGYTYLHETPHE